jgi:DNA-binding NtrC family response regulator
VAINNKNTKIDSHQIDNNLAKARNELIKAYMLKNFADEIVPLNRFMDLVESDIIRYALIISEENQKKAAYLLGMKAPTLCEKMKRYNIKLDSSLKQTAYPFMRSIEEIANLISQEESQE